jgi:cytochrome c biogenesis protein
VSADLGTPDLSTSGVGAPGLGESTRPEQEAPAAGLSTAPAPVAAVATGRRLGIGAGLRRAWRQLTSMRTALLLLFLLALAAVPGSLLPQRGLNPVKVSRYLAEHRSLGPIFDRVGLFDVFAAPWFAAVYLLLVVSLAGCLIPRSRLHFAAMRAAPPAAPRNLGRLPESASWSTYAEPDELIESIRRQLRSSRWRVLVRPGADGSLACSAEKGYLRETGNLVFHLSLLVLLAGVALGGLFGYKGTVLVQQGGGFANSVGQYDTFAPGRVFSPSRLAPFSLTLEKFTASYQPSGAARTFDAAVSYRARPDAAARRADIRVNHPLPVDGAKVYLIGHGYAPRFFVKDGAGNVAFDAAVPCLPQDDKFKSTCTVKVPDAQPDQLAFSGFFTPTTIATPTGFESGYPAAQAPGVTLLAYRGDLGLDSGIPQSVYSLDTSRLTPVGTQFLRPGDVMALPGGGSLQFSGFTEWATFQVTSDPGKLTVLVAAIGIVAGLLLSLRVRRRRLWIRATPEAAVSAAPVTVVEVGGLARSDAATFATEFATLTTALRASSVSVSSPAHASKE